MKDSSFRPRSWFGYGASWIDDVDGDGWRDLAVPDHTYTAEKLPITTHGIVFILSGSDGHVIRVIEPTEGDRAFGWSTCVTQDLDADGVGELLVYAGSHAVDGDGESVVRAYSTVGGGQVWERGEMPRRTLSSGMTGGADSNDDEIDDVLVWGGTPESKDDSSKGHLALLSGRDGRVLRELRFTRPGWFDLSGARFVGDLDGDGYEEFALAGFEHQSTWEEGRGFVEIRSGATLERLRALESAPAMVLTGRTLILAISWETGMPLLLVEGSDGDSAYILPYDLTTFELVDCVRLPPTSVHGASRNYALVELFPAELKAGTGVRGGRLHPEWWRWQTPRSVLIACDHAFLHGNVGAYSLASGEQLWATDGGEEYSRLGAVLLVDPAPAEAAQRWVLVGTANHHGEAYIGFERDSHRILCFDVATGEVRFNVDAKSAYAEAGLYLRPGL